MVIMKLHDLCRIPWTITDLNGSFPLKKKGGRGGGCLGVLQLKIKVVLCLQLLHVLI